MKTWQALVIAASVVGVALTPAAAQQTSPGASPSSTGPSSSPSASQSGVQIEASSLIGSTVRSQDGKDIGKVYQLLIDSKDGRVTSVVISMGGTLGIGEKRVTVPWDAVKVGRDEKNVVVTTDQRILEQAPPRAQDRSRDHNTPSASPSTSGPSTGSSGSGGAQQK